MPNFMRVFPSRYRFREWCFFHDCKPFLQPRQPVLCSLLTESFLFGSWFFSARTRSTLVWLAGTLELHPSNIIVENVWHTKLCIFYALNILEGCVAYQALRCADTHEKRAQGQRSGITRSQAGIGKQPQAGHRQTFPEMAKRPRQGMQDVPRQGTDKRSQAGNWQASQAGNSQAFPGRELTSVQGRDCQCAQARQWQMCPGRGP